MTTKAIKEKVRSIMSKVHLPKVKLPKIKLPKKKLLEENTPKAKLPKEKHSKAKLPKMKLPKINLPKPTEQRTEKVKITFNKKMLFSFSSKLLLLFCVPLVLIGVIVAILSSVTLRDNLNKEIKSGLEIAAVSLETTYANLYEGDYKRDKHGKLRKGDTTLSGNTDLLDALKESAGIDTSFYFDDKILLTTLKMTTGARATGLSLEEEIYARIKEGEKVFLPSYELQEVKYYGYFLPLQNEDGSVVGAIFAGRPSDEVTSQINAEIAKILTPTIAIMVVFLVVIFIFARSLSSSMKKTKNYIERVSGGDLVERNEKPVKSQDEIGDIYRISQFLRSEFKKIVGNMKESAEMLAVSSNELMQMSQNMCDNVENMNEGVEGIARDAAVQAAQTRESVENIYNISTQIEFISKEMDSVYKTVSVMADAEKKSSALMQDLNSSNTEMADTVGRIARQVAVTNEAVQSIQQTIDIIRDIADETDLLSINASIEAAHAGNAGRGFAVIAEQIGKLASQSAANAASVEKTIRGLKEESEKMVVITEEVKERMDSQNIKLNESLVNFEAVAKGVVSSRDSVEKITGRMTELDRSKEAVLVRVKNLSDIANQFVNGTEVMIETASDMDARMKNLEGTAKKLEGISGNLNDGLDVFKL